MSQCLQRSGTTNHNGPWSEPGRSVITSLTFTVYISVLSEGKYQKHNLKSYNKHVCFLLRSFLHFLCLHMHMTCTYRCRWVLVRCMWECSLITSCLYSLTCMTLTRITESTQVGSFWLLAAHVTEAFSSSSFFPMQDRLPEIIFWITALLCDPGSALFLCL